MPDKAINFTCQAPRAQIARGTWGPPFRPIPFDESHEAKRDARPRSAASLPIDVKWVGNSLSCVLARVHWSRAVWSTFKSRCGRAGQEFCTQSCREVNVSTSTGQEVKVQDDRADWSGRKSREDVLLERQWLPRRAGNEGWLRCGISPLNCLRNNKKLYKKLQPKELKDHPQCLSLIHCVSECDSLRIIS